MGNQTKMQNFPQYQLVMYFAEEQSLVIEIANEAYRIDDLGNLVIKNNNNRGVKPIYAPEQYTILGHSERITEDGEFLEMVKFDLTCDKSIRIYAQPDVYKGTFNAYYKLGFNRPQACIAYLLRYANEKKRANLKKIGIYVQQSPLEKSAEVLVFPQTKEFICENYVEMAKGLEALQKYFDRYKKIPASPDEYWHKAPAPQATDNPDKLFAQFLGYVRSLLKTDEQISKLSNLRLSALSEECVFFESDEETFQMLNAIHEHWRPTFNQIFGKRKPVKAVREKEEVSFLAKIQEAEKRLQTAKPALPKLVSDPFFNKKAFKDLESLLLKVEEWDKIYEHQSVIEFFQNYSKTFFEGGAK